jgi:hypothetical protein
MVVAKISNQRIMPWVILIWIISILIQFFLSYLSNDNLVVQSHPDGLGTSFASAFRGDEMHLPSIVVYGLYVFVRIIVRLIFPYLHEYGIGNAILNIIAVFLIVYVNLWLIFRYKRNRRKDSLFLLSGNIIALLSCMVFVKTVSLKFLITGTDNIINLNFSQLLQSDYLPLPHRYLVLANIPLVIMFIYFFIITIKKHCKVSETLLILIFCFYILFTSFLPIYDRLNPNKKPQYSLWRQYSNLIFSFPDKYYIPYYGYPIQNECIKHSINRITDVNISSKGEILFDKLPYDTKKWEIIQLIIEYKQKTTSEIYGIKAITVEQDTIFLTPNNPVNADYRFIIFRFKDFVSLKEIIFVNKANNPINFSEKIRLIGKYE